MEGGPNLQVLGRRETPRKGGRRTKPRGKIPKAGGLRQKETQGAAGAPPPTSAIGPRCARSLKAAAGMAPELGVTQGTAPRAKYSGNGKQRGPEDGDRGWAGQRKHIHRLVGTHLDAWLWKSSRLLTWAADRPCSQMCEALNVKCPANQGKQLC